MYIDPSEHKAPKLISLPWSIPQTIYNSDYQCVTHRKCIVFQLTVIGRVFLPSILISDPPGSLESSRGLAVARVDFDWCMDCLIQKVDAPDTTNKNDQEHIYDRSCFPYGLLVIQFTSSAYSDISINSGRENNKVFLVFFWNWNSVRPLINCHAEVTGCPDFTYLHILGYLNRPMPPTVRYRVVISVIEIYEWSPN